MAKKTAKAEEPKTDEEQVPETEAEVTTAPSSPQETPTEVIEEAVVVDETTVAEDVAPVTSSEPVQPVTPARSGGAVPMIAAGVVSAAVGFGAAYLALPRIDSAMIDAMAKNAQMSEDLSQKVASLEGRLADLDIDGAIAGAEASFAAQLETQSAVVTALEDRMASLEGQPLFEGGMSPAAMNALEAEIASLRSEIATQQDNMSAIAAAASAQLEETRASAAAIEEAAANKAATVAANAALAQVRAAMESGAPFAAALPDLTAVTGPLARELVDVAADGVPTLASLQENYADAARSALSSARAQGVAGEATGGFVAFLRTQFDVRSVEPKAGTDTDAILSRVGAALAAGDLATVLTEAEGLPEVARAALTDWLGAVSVRAGALAALNSINLSQN